MKLLHTADWHAGRTLAGQDRTPEISATLDALLDLAEAEAVDAVIVAGDLFDSATPSAAAEEAVWGFFARLGIPAFAIAGNHDAATRLDAAAPLLRVAGHNAVGMPRPRGSGGVMTSDEAPGLIVAAAPFVSYRRLVRAAQVLELDEEAQRGTYQDRMRAYLANLTGAFRPDAVNVLAFHGTMSGATLSTEYTFHSSEGYALAEAPLPKSATYGAFGHIHMPQKAQGTGSVPAYYCGGLIQLDFSEAGEERGVMIADLEPDGARDVSFHPLREARPLLQIDATPDTLEGLMADAPTDAWLKLRVRMEEHRPGLKERLHREHPNLLIVDFALPDLEDKEPERIDVGEIDFQDAYAAWYRDVQGRDPSPEIAAAFAEVDKSTTVEAKEEDE